jgi:AraC-type DNA-binding domain-containing proteins
MDEIEYKQKGYLRESYRLFRLSGGLMQEVGYHYHEFHKLVFFQSGQVSYLIEGKLCDLQPGDIVIVPMGCVHRVESAPDATYERVILYLSPEWLRQHSTPDGDLETCFHQADTLARHVLRPTEEQPSALWQGMRRLEESLKQKEFGAKILSDSFLCQLMVYLGREALRKDDNLISGRIVDSKTVEILRYINENITSDLSIDELADKYYISKYHMMRLFRTETGFTIHGYITEKRLLMARELIASGKSASEACYACGYKDYSAFSRAYKKNFETSPRGGRQF